MHHPIQRLHFCPHTNRLYTGISNSLKSFSATTGALLASWSAPELLPPTSKKEKKAAAATDPVVPKPELEVVKEEQESPSKKRKVEDIAEVLAEKDVQGQQRTSRLGVGVPRGGWGSEKGVNSITQVVTAMEGRYLVVVTNEDKTVRVFEVAETSGELRLLSERAMPKRPCAISLTDKESTILIADKFGDVYFIPLLPFPSDSPPAPEPTASKPEPSKITPEERERRAAEKRQRTAITLALPFAHKLLLGHVSMLVDILAVTVPAEVGTKERTYVLTADRDEHIRISRYPLGYVIEGFCLGHRSFVSKLLVPSWDLGTLISGGGDEFLMRWDWRNGKELERIGLNAIAEEIIGGKVSGGKIEEGLEGEFKIAVVGMWEVPSVKGVLVAVEKIKALFLFSLSQSLTYAATILLSGNPLDLTVDAASNSFYVALDTSEDPTPSLEKYALESGSWVRQDLPQQISDKVKVEYVGDVKALREGLLYPMGMLRKGFEKGDKED
ncbi:tRNA (guanine-N(7)-)-methyltransferase non-catalytic subunit trm82 [Rhizina undulata]